MESSDDESQKNGDGLFKGDENEPPMSSRRISSPSATDSVDLRHGNSTSSFSSLNERGSLVKPFESMAVSCGGASASAPVEVVNDDISSLQFLPDNQEGRMGYLNVTASDRLGGRPEWHCRNEVETQECCHCTDLAAAARDVGSSYRFIPLSQKEPQSLTDSDPIVAHLGAQKNNEDFINGMGCSLAVGDKCRFCCEGLFVWEGLISRIDNSDPKNVLYYGDFSNHPHFVPIWNEKPYPRHKVSKFFVPADTAELDNCLVRGHPLTHILSNRHRMKKGVVVQLCDGSTGKIYYNDPTCWRIGVKVDENSRIIHRMTYLKVIAINPTQDYLANYSSHLAVENVITPGRKRRSQDYESAGSGSGKRSKTPKPTNSVTPSSQHTGKSFGSKVDVGRSAMPMGLRATPPTGLTWMERKRLECSTAVKDVLKRANASNPVNTFGKGRPTKGLNQELLQPTCSQAMDVVPEGVTQGDDDCIVQREDDSRDGDWASKLSDLKKMAEETITKPIIEAMVAAASANPTVSSSTFSAQTPPMESRNPGMPFAPNKAKARLVFTSANNDMQLSGGTGNVNEGSEHGISAGNKDGNVGAVVGVGMGTEMGTGLGAEIDPVGDETIVKKRPEVTDINTNSNAEKDECHGVVVPGQPQMRSSNEVVAAEVANNCSTAIVSVGDESVEEGDEEALERRESNISSDSYSAVLNTLQISSSVSQNCETNGQETPTTFTKSAVEDAKSDAGSWSSQRTMATDASSAALNKSAPTHLDKTEAQQSSSSRVFTEAQAKSLDYKKKLPLTAEMVAPVRAYLSKPKSSTLMSTLQPGSSLVLAKLNGGVMVGPLELSPIKAVEDGDTNDAFQMVNESFMERSFDDEAEEQFCPFEVLYDDVTKGRRSFNLGTAQKIWDNNPLMRFEGNVRGVFCLRLTVGSVVWVDPGFDETNLAQFVPAAIDASEVDTTPCAKLETYLARMVHDFFQQYPMPMDLANAPCAAKVTKAKRTKDLCLDHRPPFEQMVSLAMQRSSFDGVAVNDVHARIANVMGKLQKKLSNAIRFGRLTFLGVDPKSATTDVDF